jgi:hypothetical protein
LGTLGRLDPDKARHDREKCERERERLAQQRLTDAHRQQVNTILRLGKYFYVYPIPALSLLSLGLVSALRFEDYSSALIFAIIGVIPIVNWFICIVGLWSSGREAELLWPIFLFWLAAVSLGFLGMALRARGSEVGHEKKRPDA